MRRWEWFQELRLPFVIENIGFSHSTCVRLLDLPMFKSSFFWHFDSVRASVFCLRARAVFVYSYLGLQSKSCIFREQDWKIKGIQLEEAKNDKKKSPRSPPSDLNLQTARDICSSDHGARFHISQSSWRHRTRFPGHISSLLFTCGEAEQVYRGLFSSS